MERGRGGEAQLSEDTYLVPKYVHLRRYVNSLLIETKNNRSQKANLVELLIDDGQVIFNRSQSTIVSLGNQ